MSIDRGISRLTDRDIDINRSWCIDIYPSRYNYSSPPVPTLSESNPIHTSPASLPKIHSDPILPYTSWSSEWSLSFGLSHQNFVHFYPLSHACHMPWGWVQIMKQLAPFSRHMFPLRYTEQRNIQIKWTEIWSHNSTFNAMWEGELCFSFILSYFRTSRVIFITSITCEGNTLDRVFLAE
jgi:hypothetical protein